MQRFTIPVWLNANVANSVMIVQNIPFTPDEMIVRSIAYRHNGAETDQINFIYCDAVNSIIGQFQGDSVHAPQSVFHVSSQLQKNITFSITQDLVGTASTLIGRLGIILEFVKYPESKK